MRESARTALSWLRATAARYGLDPAFQRDTGVICTCSWTKVPKEGVSAGETMAAALVSAFARRRLSTDDVAMTGEVTLGGQVLPAGGIAEKVLAAHRGGLRRVLLAQRNRKQVDEDLGDDLRRVVAVDYVTRVDAAGAGPAAHAGRGQRGGTHAGRPRVLSRPSASRRAATRASNQQHGRTIPCGCPPTWAGTHANDGRMPPRVGRRPLHSRRHGVPDVSSAGAAPNGHTRCGATGAFADSMAPGEDDG